MQKKKKEGLSEDVRRRKRNRNINRKGLRSGSCYIWRWLCSRTGRGEGDRLIYITVVISRVERRSKQRQVWGMLRSTLRDLYIG